MKLILSFINILALTVLVNTQVSAAEGHVGPFEQIWGNATVYNNSDNDILQKLVCTGRLQADYANFDEVQYAATGFVWSLNASGNLIATV